MKLQNMRIESIVIPDRARKNMGDLAGLGKSIMKHGLMQPVVVHRETNRLIAGQRRIAACIDLGWEQIPVCLVDNEEEYLQQMEFDENEFRKPFTPSERVNLAHAIKDSLKRKAKEERKKKKEAEQNGKAEPQTKGQEEEPHEEAAKKAGFGSGKQLQRAETVINNAAQCVIDAMDNGVIKIAAAKAISELDHDQQERCLKFITEDKLKVREAINKVKEEAKNDAQEPEPAKPLLDAKEVPVPDHLVGPFTEKVSEDLARAVGAVARMCKSIGIWNPFFRSGEAQKDLAKLKKNIKGSVAHIVCPECKGESSNPLAEGGQEKHKCELCRNSGFLPESFSEEHEAQPESGE